MKPARIHVFDGLRVATEHIEHLQDGIHSSIEDLRAVLGLGVVLHGLEVRPQGERGVEVQPGFAFDRHRNRIVLDEPQRVDVTFDSGQDRRFVCARYERIEDGEVEGRPTLVWDSASVVLSDTLPTADDDLVPLAAVVRAADATGPSFDIVSIDELPATPPDALAAEPSAEAPPAGEGEPTPPGSPPEESPPPMPVGEGEAISGEGEAPVGEGEAPPPEAPAPPPESATAPEPARAEAPAAPEAPALVTNGAPQAIATTPRLRQGVLALAPSASSGRPLAPVTDALRARLREGGEGDVRVVLASAELQPGFPVAGLTGKTTLSAELQSTARPPWQGWATAHGEATLGEGAVAQFGLSTVYSRWLSEGNGAAGTLRPPELSDGLLARLPLSPEGLASPGEPEPGTADDQLVLTVEAVPGSPGFTLACVAVWNGDVDEERISALESGTTGFSWSARVGWKVVGG